MEYHNWDFRCCDNFTVLLNCDIVYYLFGGVSCPFLQQNVRVEMLVPTCESARRRNPSYLSPEALEFVFLMCKRLETKHISSKITASYVLE